MGPSKKQAKVYVFLEMILLSITNDAPSICLPEHANVKRL